MVDRLDISKGAEPILAMYDIHKDEYSFRLEGKTYSFHHLPFTVLAIAGKRGVFADKALILKHAHG